MNDDLNLSMFRAYDIRTPSGNLTPELAERLARAEARYFREVLGVRGVVLAHDARSTGPRYLTIASDVYLNAGLDVFYLPGVTSTSHFYFTAMQYPWCAAVMCGASHNPAGDTGRKTLGPNVRPIAEHIGPEGGLDKIKELYIEDKPFATIGRGIIRPVNNLDDYVNYSMRLAGVGEGSLHGMWIMHDYLFGAGGREMMIAFDRAGANLKPMHFAPDGSFPLGDPNPVKPAVVKEGIEMLTSPDREFVFGAFFDGDADRIDIYGGDGHYLSSSFVYAAIVPAIKARWLSSSDHLDVGQASLPAKANISVFADLKSNPLALMEIARAGVGVQVMRNGHSQIKDALRREPDVIGAVEESAHFYESFYLGDKGPYCTENTLYIALLTARAWQENPGRFKDLFDIQARTSREREWGHYFPTDGHRARALDAVERYFVGEGASVRTATKSGMSLEATMMRRGLPFEIDERTALAPDWLQVCQRVSQSENGLARWEIVAADASISVAAREAVERIVKEHEASEPYRG